jgi:hypothetical protein
MHVWLSRRAVRVGMRVRLTRRIIRTVPVLMMFIMRV